MADINQEALVAYFEDPLAVLNKQPGDDGGHWIENAIVGAMARGGYTIEPGDACGIVANMIRDAVAAKAAAPEVIESDEDLAAQFEKARDRINELCRIAFEKGVEVDMEAEDVEVSDMPTILDISVTRILFNS